MLKPIVAPRAKVKSSSVLMRVVLLGTLLALGCTGTENDEGLDGVGGSGGSPAGAAASGARR